MLAFVFPTLNRTRSGDRLRGSHRTIWNADDRHVRKWEGEAPAEPKLNRETTGRKTDARRLCAVWVLRYAAIRRP